MASGKRGRPEHYLWNQNEFRAVEYRAEEDKTYCLLKKENTNIECGWSNSGRNTGNIKQHLR